MTPATTPRLCLAVLFSLCLSTWSYASGMSCALCVDDLADVPEILAQHAPDRLSPTEVSIIKIQRAYRKHDRVRSANKFLNYYGSTLPRESPSYWSSLAARAFQFENYPAASFFAGKEAWSLPIKRKGHFAFRYWDGNDSKSLVKVDENFAYFYKAISKEHLAKIAVYGLDSNYGGRRGASQAVHLSNAFIEEMDRGRQYLASNLAQAANYAELLEQGTQRPSIVLRIKIPLNKTLELNLTQVVGLGLELEYFIAGGTIPPEWIEYSPVSITKLRKKLKADITEATFSRITLPRNPADRKTAEEFLNEQINRRVYDKLESQTEIEFRPFF